MINLQEEKAKFNAISQEDAAKIGVEVDGTIPEMRSCWFCNSAHEHLRSHDYIICFSCGVRYVRGIPAHFLGKRMRGEEITDADMDEFQKMLDGAE